LSKSRFQAASCIRRQPRALGKRLHAEVCSRQQEGARPPQRPRQRANEEILCLENFGANTAEEFRSTSRPSLSIRSVGILRTLNREAVNGFFSTSILATRTRPPISAANCSTTGAIIRQGLHQAAHIWSSTGTGERSTSVEKVASVTSTGLSDSGVLQRPHTGSHRCATFSRGTRFLAPQAWHRIKSTSDIPIFLSHPARLKPYP